MGRLEQIWRSFAAKIVVLAVIFVAVPVILYDQFRAADEEKNRLLIDSVEAQGRLAAAALRPLVESVDGQAMRTISQTVQRLGEAGTNIKLVFRPEKAPSNQSFYYVASAPAVSAQYLEQERQELLSAGVLDRLKDSCAEVRALAVRYTNPAGGLELLTSITPIKAPSGCWAVITSNRTAEFLVSSLGQPYWQTGAVRFAAAIYLVMAVIITAFFVQVGVNLNRFGRLARNLRTGREPRGSFASLNRIPELLGVAEEFDRLVDALRSSQRALRFAAQEMAHAFKTPLGIIAQSLEPLRRRVDPGDVRAQRALERIDRSLDRLDGLVSAARSLDESIADSINPPRERVPLSDLVEESVREYREAHAEIETRFTSEVAPGLDVIGAPALLEAVMQNLLDNALSFSSPGGEIRVSLVARGDAAELAVADQGPGVPAENIERIFERFVSIRASESESKRALAAKGDATRRPTHLGLGLWIVRRNVEAMGGVVVAENRAEGGFRVVVALPLARARRGR